MYNSPKIRPMGRDVPCGRTDRHDEAYSRFSQFCERVLTILRTVRLEAQTFRIQNRTHLTALFGSILKHKNGGRWTQRFEQDKGTDFCKVETVPL